MGGHSVIKAPLSSRWTPAFCRISSAPPRSKPPFIFRAAIIEKAVRHKWSGSASVASTSNNLSGVTCPALLSPRPPPPPPSTVPAPPPACASLHFLTARVFYALIVLFHVWSGLTLPSPASSLLAPPAPSITVPFLPFFEVVPPLAFLLRSLCLAKLKISLLSLHIVSFIPFSHLLPPVTPPLSLSSSFSISPFLYHVLSPHPTHTHTHKPTNGSAGSRFANKTVCVRNKIRMQMTSPSTFSSSSFSCPLPSIMPSFTSQVMHTARSSSITQHIPRTYPSNLAVSAFSS